MNESSPDDLREVGWSVACHNDYRFNGKDHTFWLMTRNGRSVKGEGETDAIALNQIRSATSRESDSGCGSEYIGIERIRQMTEEGWTSEHDDDHRHGEMVNAACCYAYQSIHRIEEGKKVGYWPWDEKWWKPSANPIRNLVKAGALIAAEIDRLLRMK